MNKPIIETRMVQDPSMSDSEFIYQRQKKPGPHVGKIAARVNMVELMGGFARFKNTTEAQKMSAAKFRSIWERAQIGGARAMDYAAVKVDTSGPSEDATFEIGDDARRQYIAAVQYLGMMRSSLVERIVVHDMSLRDIASGSRERDRIAQEVRDAMDHLAVHFKLQTRKAA